jgi:peptidoglycan/LPS O-acetylase OafA/YrhL
VNFLRFYRLRQSSLLEVARVTVKARHHSSVRYRPEIDGLRAVSVFSVVLFHANLTVFEYKLFPAGYFGVDIFFVISGYLIGAIVLQDLQRNNFSFSRFYIGRARRILPALLLVMATCIPFAWLLLLPHQYEGFCKSLLATLAFGSNILFWRQAGYFAEPSQLEPLLHTWTLGVEEQYYLLFPLALVVCWRYFRWAFYPLLIIGVVLSFGTVLWARQDQLIASFFLLPTRLWEFLVGFFIAAVAPKGLSSEWGPVASVIPTLGLTLIIFAVTCFDERTVHPGWPTLMPVVGAGLIILFGGRGDAASKLLSLKWMVGIGLISYSLYLWHHPVFSFTYAYQIGAVSDLQKLGLLLATLALAYISTRLVEQPFREAATVPLFLFGVFVCVGVMLMILIGLHGILTSGAPDRYEGLPGIATHVDDYDSGYMIGDKNCYLSPCILGDQFVEPTLVLKGNSHAGVLVRGLNEALMGNNISAHVLAGGGVHIADNRFPTYYEPAERFNRLIDAHNRIMNDSKIEYVILSSRMTHGVLGTGFDNQEGGVEHLGGWRAHLPQESQHVLTIFREGIEDLLSRDKKVVIVYPIPEVGWRVPQTLVKKLRHGDWTPLTTSYALYKERNRAVIEMLDSLGERDDLIRVYPDRIFCDTYVQNRCATHNDNVIFYFDSDHLSDQGARLVVAEVLEKMGEKWGYLGSASR